MNKKISTLIVVLGFIVAISALYTLYRYYNDAHTAPPLAYYESHNNIIPYEKIPPKGYINGPCPSEDALMNLWAWDAGKAFSGTKGADGIFKKADSLKSPDDARAILKGLLRELYKTHTPNHHIFFGLSGAMDRDDFIRMGICELSAIVAMRTKTPLSPYLDNDTQINNWDLTKEDLVLWTMLEQTCCMTSSRYMRYDHFLRVAYLPTNKEMLGINQMLKLTTEEPNHVACTWKSDEPASTAPPKAP